MARIRFAARLSLHCAVNDDPRPWQTPRWGMMILHGSARKGTSGNRCGPAIADNRRVYRQ